MTRINKPYIIRNDNSSTSLVSGPFNNGVAFDGTFKILHWKDTGTEISGRINGGVAGVVSYTRSGTFTVNRFCIGGVLRSTFAAGFTGNIKEIIISSPNSDSDRQKIEGYLAHKWGLTGYLPNDHPYKLGHPLSTGSPSFIADTPFGDGKAIDLADGHVEISTGGNEDIFDGNGSFSVSAWVKGWPSESDESVVSKGYENLDGWSVGRGSSGPNVISVNLGGVGGSKTATHSTALSTDNQVAPHRIHLRRGNTKDLS